MITTRCIQNRQKNTTRLIKLVKAWRLYIYSDFKIVLFDTVMLISPSKCEGEIQVPERWSDSFY